MRIFKNRGDIYIPSTKIKSDLEQKILLILLAFGVTFTCVFLVLVGIKYDFSIKNFFAPSNMVTQENNAEVSLPKISGKTNFLFTMNNSNTDEIYFCSLIQVDMDTISYKVCTLDKNTYSDGKTLSDIYKSGGAGNVVNAVKLLLGVDIDYYIDESVDEYKKMYDAFGSINYLVLNEIRYKDTSTYGFNIKLKGGNQSVNGDLASKLIRYYLSENDYETVNEIMLTALSQQINPENHGKKEKLFSSFIELSKTNITITDFSKSENALKVLSSETTGVNVYSVVPDYDNNALTDESINNIKGYFTK